MTAKTIAHFTDIHLGQKVALGGNNESDKMHYDNVPDEHLDNLKVVLDDIVARGVSEIIFGGDIGTTDAHKRFFDLIRAHNLKLSMVLGNHDKYADVSRYVDCVNKEAEIIYTHEDASHKQIILDSSSNIIGDGQLRWLGNELNTQKTILLFLHHPVLAIDTPLDRYGAALRNREEVKFLLQNCDKKLVIFCGHYHMNDDAVEGNIRQVVTPAASYQIERFSNKIALDTSVFGYRLIRLNNADVQTEVIMFKS